MKSTLILRIAFLSFFLAGLGFTNMENHLQAQSSLSEDVYAEPTGSFVTNEVASSRIDNSVTLYKTLLENLTPHSPEYLQVQMKYDYAIAVQNLFMNGKTIPQAIVEGLAGVSAPDQYNAPKGALFTLKQDMVNLLKV